MFQKYSYSPGRLILLLVALIGGVALSSCGINTSASSQQSNAVTGNLSGQSTAQLITQLQQAKTQDENNAKDPTISVLRRSDFLNHDTEAQLAVRDLQLGLPVSKDRITYALEVPPKHLGPEQRAMLIQQLKDGIHKDERREQAVVAFTTDIYDQDPGASSKFGVKTISGVGGKELQQNTTGWAGLNPGSASAVGRLSSVIVSPTRVSATCLIWAVI